MPQAILTPMPIEKAKTRYKESRSLLADHILRAMRQTGIKPTWRIDEGIPHVILADNWVFHFRTNEITGNAVMCAGTANGQSAKGFIEDFKRYDGMLK